MGMVIGGVALGVGSQIVTHAGSPQTATALGEVSNYMPVMGNVIGAGMVLDSTSYLKKPLKKVRW